MSWRDISTQHHRRRGLSYIMLPFAPGARVVIRDEEWLIRRVDPSTDGGWLLTCDGISELVRGQSALFLTELEDQIEVLDPAATELVPMTAPPTTPRCCTWRAMRRRSVANDERIHLGHRGVMNLVPYQLDPRCRRCASRARAS
jgi:hypothetical protein